MKFFVIIPLAMIVALLPFIGLANIYIYRGYAGMSRAEAYLLSLGAVLGSVGLGGYRIHVMNSWRGSQSFALLSGERDDDAMVAITTIAVFLLPLVLAPFLAKLYFAWIGGRATDAEKAPGREGIRAWLRGGNLDCAIAIALCFWLGYGYSFWGVAALSLMALLAFPILTTATTATPVPAAKIEDLSSERERVLKMLDDGKINAQESAELLNALGQSAHPRAASIAPPPQRRMVWIGLALLCIGFFLPWFVIDAQRTMNEMMNRMQAPQAMLNLSGMVPEGATAYIRGGDIEHGLGWCILLLGIVAAALPFIAANLDAQTCQKTCLIALGVGAIILMYLFTQSIRFVSVGIVLGAAGYVFEFIGVLKGRKVDWGSAG